MTARCSASQSPSKRRNIPFRIRFIASVLLFVSFFKFLEILLQHSSHRAHEGKGKALAMRQEVPFPNGKDCSNSCNESSSFSAGGKAGNFSQEVIKTLKKRAKERTVAGPWNQSRGSTSLSLFSLVENKMTSSKSEKTIVVYSTNVSTIGVQKNSSLLAGLLGAEAVVHWEYYFSDSNKIVLSQVVLESAAQYAEAYTKSAKQRWVALSRNHSRSAPAKQDDAQPNIKRIWIWGVFGHLRAILTRNGLVTHMLSAGERCSCTTAVTDLFLRNFDVQCSEGATNNVASASSSQSTTKPSVPRKCVIGGLPWKHGTFLLRQ